ncbi:MAG: hypothetical protein RBR45_14145 [Pseudomonas sp.]|nr:hypothetical protein [Pseudomonas sp.]
MAEQKISTMTELTDINAGDYVEVSEDDGAGRYNTKKYDLGDLADAVSKKHDQGTDTTLGTMTADIDMDNTYQVIGLVAPAAAGEAIRQTTSITESNLEQLTDGSDTTLHDHDGISENTSARHSQNTDTKLDEGGANEVTAAEIVTLKDTTVPAKADKLILETAEKTADYILADGDQDKVVLMNKTGAATLTVPANDTVAFSVGTIIGVYNRSSDAVTISGDAGVTVRNAGYLAQYGEVSLRKRATNEWVLAGTVRDVPQHEIAALINFFHATNGPNWTNNTGWGIDPVVGNWYGVTVVNGHVTRLALNANRKTLSGPGAPFLVALSELGYLNLEATGVTGDISGFSGLANLTILYLYNTGVTGDISGFSGLANLTVLNLNVPGVTGDISGFNSLVNLTFLSLFNTGVTGSIGGFNNLVNLIRLYLDSTGVAIDTIPVFVKPDGTLQLGGSNPAPTWGTVESPTQVTLNIVENLRNGWAITVTGGIPAWVQDMV